MGTIIVKHIKDEELEGKGKESIFTIEGKEVKGQVDRLSLNPLRFLEYALIQQGTKIKKLVNGDDPWNIEELRIESEAFGEIERLLLEIMEYRCHPEYDFKWENIIRQLPFDVLMKTSDAIMNYGKNPEEIEVDKLASDMRWKEIARNVASEYGYGLARRYANGNPNNTVDSLTIPKNEPKKRLHLIYKSARGGYNIKTQTYEDSSLDHYCFYDSHRWD